MEDPERCNPLDAQVDLLVGQAEGTTLFDHGKLSCLVQAPSPGIVIFVSCGYTSNTSIPSTTASCMPARRVSGQ